jgi:hypothetical protein
MARDIYAAAKPGHHPIAAQSLAALFAQYSDPAAASAAADSAQALP